MVADIARRRDQTLQQARTDTATTDGTLDIDREFGDVIVRRPRIENVQAAPTDHARAALCDQHRVTRAPGLEPGTLLLGRAQARLQRRDAILDALVVDFANHCCVVGPGRTNGDGFSTHEHHPAAEPVERTGLAIQQARWFIASPRYRSSPIFPRRKPCSR